jgi:predicted nucleic acid-binding protein
MDAVFVDTSAWDAIEDGGDRAHTIALRCKEDLAQQRKRLYTTNFVLDETFTLLLLNIGYARTVTFKQTVDQLRSGSILTVVHVTEEIERAAWEVFERFNQDKTWSFTDCTTKVVMARLSISQVFAFDHHFEQMGLVRIPQ